LAAHNVAGMHAFILDTVRRGEISPSGAISALPMNFNKLGPVLFSLCLPKTQSV